MLHLASCSCQGSARCWHSCLSQLFWVTAQLHLWLLHAWLGKGGPRMTKPSSHQSPTMQRKSWQEYDMQRKLHTSYVRIMHAWCIKNGQHMQCPHGTLPCMPMANILNQSLPIFGTQSRSNVAGKNWLPHYALSQLQFTTMQLKELCWPFVMKSEIAAAASHCTLLDYADWSAPYRIAETQAKLQVPNKRMHMARQQCL